MQETNDQQLVVVTGASSGIGLATAESLASTGYHVIAGVMSVAEAGEVRAQNIEPVILDITNEQNILALSERIAHDPNGRQLRALVNNAGVELNTPFEVLPMAEWRRQFEINLFGQVAITKALIPFLRDSHGTIINITSVGGRVALPNYSAYAATKFAFEGLSDSLRRELAEQKINVVIVEPGGVQTEMAAYSGKLSLAFEQKMSKENQERYGKLIESAVASQSAFLKHAMLAEKAGRQVAKIVAKKRPRARYSLGVDAKMSLTMVRLLPAKMVDCALAMSRQMSRQR